MRNWKNFATILLATTAMAATTSAQAQDANSSNASSGGIEEIVVTAQKRAESAQNVPIAISVFSR